MPKPFLIIEVPGIVNDEDLSKIKDSVESQKAILDEYHVIISRGTSDYFHYEILTASDISLHKKDTCQKQTI